MRRTAILVLALVALAFASLVFGQDATPDPFTVYRQFGQSQPIALKYEPNYDQLAMVTTNSEFKLVDAETFLVNHTLYESGSYNAYQFSHDGRMLALALDRRVEVWDTQAGELLLSLEPDGANSVTGPLAFSDDDTLLVFTAVVPASQETRRSENDTDLLPWLWDLNAALDIADSRLPGRVDAYSFFDYRTGNLYLGPNNVILAAIPDRFQLIDAEATRLVSFLDIETARFENDPISLWFSAAGDLMYVLKNDTNTLVQVDTRTQTVFEVPVGRQLTARSLREFENFSLGNEARIIGDANSREINPLVRQLFGYDYRADWNYHPLTVMLLDVLLPQTAFAGDPAIMVYIFDDTAGVGTLEFFSPSNGDLIALDPDQQHIAFRQIGSQSPITVYNLDTGLPDLRFETTLPDEDGSDIFAYDGAGENLQAGYQRYNADTGEVVYELLDYNNGYDNYYFSDDSTQLVTMSGSDWWLWDIETSTVIRREKLNFSGSVRQTWRDGQRFLLDISEAGRPGIEVYEIGKDDRQRIFFDTPSDMSIQQIIPDETWTNFLVIYSAASTSLQYPNGAIATYRMGVGKLTFVAGSDLPPSAVDYGWLPDGDVYVVGGGSSSSPDRIYGVDYDPSGVPACLVERYPEQLTAWTLVWERIVYYQPADTVSRLAQAVCAAPDAAAVAALYTPTPEATFIPVATNALTRIAGVPACLTQRYPDQALAFAREWRTLTDGMTEPQIEELEVLLCESIGSAEEFAGGYTGLPRTSGGSGALIYTINAETGERTRVPSLPERRDNSPALNLVEELFNRQFGFYPSRPLLSPDRNLLAVPTSGGHVLLYRLNKAYDELVIEATATALGTSQSIPNAIRVRPTATLQPDIVGTPGPTLTATYIPTGIPLATQTAVMAESEVVEEICPAPEPVLFSEQPSGFTPRGRILGTVPDSRLMWELDFSDGRLYPDETIPRCSGGLSCNFSYDQEWILVNENGIYSVSRPDGSDRQILFTPEESNSIIDSVSWYDWDRLQFSYRGYLPEVTDGEVQLTQLYDVRDGSLTEPQRPLPSVSINGLPTDVVSRQPNGGSLSILTTPLNLPYGTGYRYYLYDRATNESEYFAQADAGLSIQFEWNPLGTKLYYKPTWVDEPLVYDVATGEHRVIPSFASGIWSRTGRYRLDAYYLPEDQLEDRVEAGQPIPSLKLWDSETGSTRYYCPPTSWRDNFSTIWSPDDRYLALSAFEPGDQLDMTRTYHTVYILDTVTGLVVDMQADMTDLLVWVEGER